MIIAAALIAALAALLEQGEEPKEEKQTLIPSEREQCAGQRIAVLIDDIGNDLGQIKALAALEAPIACAILPQAAHALEAAALLHIAGKEILLHMPMEPISYPAENPGLGALFVAMDEPLIRQRLDEALASVPHAQGVNNHMGSRFMTDDAGLDVVMETLSRRGLFFVDSRTTAVTRGRAAAARAGIPFAERDLFIDHRPGYHSVLEVLLRETLQTRSHAKDLLLIGHPHAGTIKALREALPRWHKEGVQMIPLSTLVRVPAAAEKEARALAGRQDSKEKGEGTS